MIFLLFFNMITFCLESWWAQNRHNLCCSQKWAIPGRFDLGVHKTRLRKQLKRVGEEEEDDDDLPEMESANGATGHIGRNRGDCGGHQFPVRQKRTLSLSLSIPKFLRFFALIFETKKLWCDRIYMHRLKYIVHVI